MRGYHCSFFRGMALTGVSCLTIGAVSISMAAGPTPAGPAVGVAIAGNWLSLARSSSTEIYDISAPASPVKTGEILVGSPCMAIDAYPEQKMVFVAFQPSPLDFADTLHDSMQIVDMSNPASPQLIGHDLNYFAHGMAMPDSIGIMAASDSGLFLTNFANLPYRKDNSYYKTPAPVYSIWHDGNGNIFAAAGDSGIFIYRKLTSSTLTRTGTFHTAGPARAFIGVADTLYVAEGKAGVEMVSLSNPLNLVRLLLFDTPGSACDVAVNASAIYVADSLAGLLVFAKNGQASIRQNTRYQRSVQVVRPIVCVGLRNPEMQNRLLFTPTGRCLNNRSLPTCKLGIYIAR
jgi:hypothetical protein